MATILYDSLGRAVPLRSEIGRGGEGTVWETSDPNLAAKVYHQAVDPEKAEKLRVMARRATPELLQIAAWPTNTLYDRAGGSLVGILIPRIVGYREIHQLYSPAQRRTHFPDRDWSFLIHVAMNSAAAVETVHAAGHVIGDLNQGGFLVSGDGTIRLIDCDSFQIRDANKVYRCVVGVPQYTPPELQGANFRAVDRAESHDCFGLALLVFHLLFMGRHPYAGRFQGQGEMPIERAISEGRFAFSRSATSFQMQAPPHSLALDSITPPLSQMFERAFHYSTNKPARPTAQEWRQALYSFKLSLVKCRTDPAHLFSPSQVNCPWCQIEQGGGPAFFSTSNVALNFDGTFNLFATWARIQAVRRPPKSDELIVPSPPRNIVPIPLPPDARCEFLDETKPLPSEPIYIAEPIPPIPEFSPEVVPAPSPFVPIPSPETPRLPAIDLLAQVDAAYRSSLKFGDYLTAKWGTILLAVISSGLWWYLPGMIVSLVLAIPFAVTWLVYYIPRRRSHREQRQRATLQMKSLRAEREIAVRNLETQRHQVEVLNAKGLLDWQQRMAHLEQLRREAPAREIMQRQEWHAEVMRVQRRRAEIELDNQRRRESWRMEIDRYLIIREQVEKHNAAIVRARSKRDSELLLRTGRLRYLQSQLEEIRRTWSDEVRPLQTEYHEALRRLEAARSEYEELRNRFEQEKQALTVNQRQIQLIDHLRNSLIEDAQISGIGSARKATLAAYGIERALDLEEGLISQVPGFGPQRISDLMTWKASVVQSFRFNSQKAIPPVELRALHMRYHGQRVTIQKQLQAGEEQLQEIAGRGERRLQGLQERLAKLVLAIAQAEANVRVC